MHPCPRRWDDLGGWSLVVHGKGAKLRTVPLPAGLARELIDQCGRGFAFPGDDAAAPRSGLAN